MTYIFCICYSGSFPFVCASPLGYMEALKFVLQSSWKILRPPVQQNLGITDVCFIFEQSSVKGCGVLFSPMVSGWAGGRPGGRAAGNSLSGLYLRNRKV